MSTMDWCCKAMFRQLFGSRYRPDPGDKAVCGVCGREWPYEAGTWWKGTIPEEDNGDE